MKILVGIDDTDTLDSPGTNQVARAVVSELGAEFHCLRIVRHQLFFDSRIPYTSKNSSCSLLFTSTLPAESALSVLQERFREALLRRFQPGSDPGLCLTYAVTQPVIDFGKCCQSEVTTQAEARDLARQGGLFLDGLGGTEDGVIGALAAVGLAATENDGRVVQIGQQPDDVSNVQTVAFLKERGVQQVCCEDQPLSDGTVDVGKHLRPNLRNGKIILFVEPDEDHESDWRAVRKL